MDSQVKTGRKLITMHTTFTHRIDSPKKKQKKKHQAEKYHVLTIAFILIKVYVIKLAFLCGF